MVAIGEGEGVLEKGRKPRKHYLKEPRCVAVAVWWSDHPTVVVYFRRWIWFLAAEIKNGFNDAMNDKMIITFEG